MEAPLCPAQSPTVTDPLASLPPLTDTAIAGEDDFVG